MISRILQKTITDRQKKGFINIIYGPRRVGKTVLLDQLTQNLSSKKISFNGDTQETRDILSSTSKVQLSQLIQNYDVITVDEAQRIPNIGLSLKIIIDA